MSDPPGKPPPSKLKRAATAAQLRGLEKAHKMARAKVRMPKRAGAAYSKKKRAEAKRDAIAAHAHRLASRLAAGTGLEPPAPIDVTTYADDKTKRLYSGRASGKRAAVDPGAFQIPPPPGLDEIPPAPPDPTSEESCAPEATRAAGGPRVRYTRLVADAICQRIAEGVPIQEICELEGMPSAQQVLAWARTNAAFKALYDEARMLQADFLADLQLGLARRVLEMGSKEASAVRVAADILAKQAEWRAPRKFGPKLDLTVSEPPKTPDEVRAEIRALEEALGIPEERRASH